MSTNFGKANVEVKLLDAAPNIKKNRSLYNFDITAHSWEILQQSAYFSPVLIENVKDNLGSVSACFPSKRKLLTDNILGDLQPITSDMTSVDRLKSATAFYWKPIDAYLDQGGGMDSNAGAVYDIWNDDTEDGGWADQTRFWQSGMDNPVSRQSFTQDEIASEAPPNDGATLKKWFDWVGSTYVPPSREDLPKFPKMKAISQQTAYAGLMWGAEMSSRLQRNWPFWITLKRNSSPTTNRFQTSIIIQLGIGTTTDEYDLVLTLNQKPVLIDYYRGRGAAGAAQSAPSEQIELPDGLSKFWDSDENVEIGFMVIGGRLVIFVNKTFFVYTRTVKGGTNEGRLAEASLRGGVRLFATNFSATFYASYMSFSRMGLMALPIATPPPVLPSLVKEKGIQSPTGGGGPQYNNVKSNGQPGTHTVCMLPRDPDSNTTLYGCDCKEFIGPSGVDDPDGDFFHVNGTVLLTSSTSLGISNISVTDFYVLIMSPSDLSVTYDIEDTNGTDGFKIVNGGCPYFFRLKGGAINDKIALGPNDMDVTEDVLSVTETSQAPDYFHIKGTASISLYNKGGRYDFLKNVQRAVTIKWYWNDDRPTLTFTGLTLSANSSERAGMEVIDVSCQDYTFVLSNTPIVNSPFYDGMVMFYAVRDMAERAGIVTIINDWDNTDDYFLPSGYAFTKPAVRFSSTQMIFECIMSVVKRAEAFIFFDASGFLHVKKLPGGLFSVGAGESIVERFTRNPAGPNTILDEKSIQYDLNSTVNRISIFTLDRDTRNAIIYTKSANVEQDRLMYRRIFLEDQAALGEYEVAVARAEELGKRIFYPIRKTSFKTVGTTNIVFPLDFIEVDGEEFRVMSVSRRYNASNNDFLSEYNAEWLGGA